MILAYKESQTSIKKSERDGILYSRRDTMAELVMVDPFTGASKYIYTVAPIKLMKQKLKASKLKVINFTTA